jgi:hypothetical protein
MIFIFSSLSATPFHAESKTSYGGLQHTTAILASPEGTAARKHTVIKKPSICKPKILAKSSLTSTAAISSSVCFAMPFNYGDFVRRQAVNAFG